MEAAEKVQEVGKEDIYCEVCKQNQGTPIALRRHIDKFHKGEYLYSCSKCGKGFMNKKGITEHANVHKDIHDRIKCEKEDCDQTFSSNGALKKHMKEKHSGTVQKFNCQHCNKELGSKCNRDAHEKSCKDNPGRVELKCDVCGKGGFYLPKRVMEHKRDRHGWK